MLKDDELPEPMMIMIYGFTIRDATKRWVVLQFDYTVRKDSAYAFSSTDGIPRTYAFERRLPRNIIFHEES